MNDTPKKPFRRGPVETIQGMIDVDVYVQQEREDYWYAVVAGMTHLTGSGSTREEAVREALLKASMRRQPKPTPCQQ
jgi:hypothetical protein